MENIILCEFHMFDLHQNIMLISDSGASCVSISNLENLGADIAEACNQHKINKVHLIGNESFANETIIPSIHETSGSKFNNNNIIVEVN